MIAAIAKLGLTKVTGGIAGGALLAGMASGAWLTNTFHKAGELKGLRTELKIERKAAAAREGALRALQLDRDTLKADFDLIASSNARLRATAGRETIRYVNEVSNVKDDTLGQCLDTVRPASLFSVLQSAHSGQGGSAKPPQYPSELAGGSASPATPN